MNLTTLNDERRTMKERLGLKFRSTGDIIRAAEAGVLPDKIMITVHPQRWNDKFIPWAKELIFQNAKNMVKKYFIVNRNYSAHETH